MDHEKHVDGGGSASADAADTTESLDAEQRGVGLGGAAGGGGGGGDHSSSEESDAAGMDFDAMFDDTTAVAAAEHDCTTNGSFSASHRTAGWPRNYEYSAWTGMSARDLLCEWCRKSSGFCFLCSIFVRPCFFCLSLLCFFGLCANYPPPPFRLLLSSLHLLHAP
jgi:hypothetical protein